MFPTRPPGRGQIPRPPSGALLEINLKRRRYMKKKLFSLALVLVLCIGLTVPALSYDSGRAGMPTIICDNKDNVAFIDANGILWMSGGNHNGQLGIGSREDISTPAKVTENVASISLGDGHTAAIKANSLWMWGDNTYGELGNGGKGNIREDAGGAVYEAVFQTVPAKVIDDVAAVSCGNNFTAAIKTDGLCGCGATTGLDRRATD